MAKILLVEDDKDLVPPLIEWLQSDGHTVEHIDAGEDALQLLGNFRYDLVILDRGLPDISGGAVLRKFRSSGGSTPVIFLTGESDLANKKDGFDSGADDYLTKPFEPEELCARIRAILRRPVALIPDTLKIGGVELDTKTQQVKLDNELILLAKREHAVLELLMRNVNRCFSSQDIIAHIWKSDADGTEDAVRSLFKRLRRKLTDKDGNSVITTIHGAGYTIQE